MTTTSGKTPVTSALLGGCAQRTAKAFLIVTDLGLLAYWTLTAVGVISVGTGDVLLAWNWSFLPLDLFAVSAGRSWGLLAVSFFALWGAWALSWWLVNLWLMLMPIGLFLTPRLFCSGTASS